MTSIRSDGRLGFGLIWLKIGASGTGWDGAGDGYCDYEMSKMAFGDFCSD